jgi:Transglycosylase SLT domain
MSKSSRVHTIRLPLRKICSSLPALALISGGIVFPASAAPTADIQVDPVASSSPTIVVPDIALTLPAATQVLDDLSPLNAREAPAPVAPAPKPLVSMLPAGTVPGSSSLVTLDSSGIPVRALAAYRRSASMVDSADPACHIDWTLVAAIGRVESNHARFGGNQLDLAGVAQPGIIGIPLDGSNGTARITDTDHGLLDRDTTYDRAVGPMQFIPSTWRFAGVDANGDGVKNPQNMADAATATAVYLCSGPGDLSRPADLHAAILRYNPSDSYVRLVGAIADAYRLGVTALPASDLALATSATVSSPAARAATKATNPESAQPAFPQPSSTPTKATAKKPALAPRAAATIPPSSALALSQPAQTPPTETQPAQPTPTTTSTLTPCLSTPAPTGTTPTTPAEPCLPPCLSTPAPTGTTPTTPAGPCLPPCLSTPAPTGTTPTTPAEPCFPTPAP